MDFEQMKMIWDSQNNEPLYAINEVALHHNVRRKARRFRQLVVFFEATVITVTMGLGAFYVIASLARGQQYDRLVSGAILLATAACFIAGTMRRRRREEGFPQSLLGDIDKALWQVRNHVSRARGLRWSLIAPLSVAFGIDWAFPLGAGRYGWPFMLLFFALMALSAWAMEYEIRGWYLPKERRLEDLRRMLVESGSDPQEQ